MLSKKIFSKLIITIISIGVGLSQEWIPIESGFAGSITSLSFANDSHGAASCSNGVILKTVDSGLTWSTIQSPATSTLNDISYINEDIIVAVGDGPIIIRSVNGGVDWSIIPSGISYGLLSVDIDSSGNGIAGGFGQTIIITDDYGASWSTYQTDMFGGKFSGAHMIDDNIGFVFGENSIFGPLVARTTNGGASWQFDSFYLVENDVSYEGYLLDGYFFDANHGQIIGHRFDNHGAISTTEDYSNWSTLHFFDTLNDIDFMNENEGFASGANGLVLSTIDGGESWSEEYMAESLTLNTIAVVGESVILTAGEFGTIFRQALGPSGIIGDVNNDGSVDVLDIVRIVNIIVGNLPEPTGYELWAGDFNADGNLNVLDVIAIINVIIGTN
ncbi:MAG: hypothetical protein HN729_02315 [Candidatus Marinimicrobia bacterium]|jgi:photosystem II stability/assembly factor-like uncharacterized protein|nr:hypothetical protein [Candidatus Neomarinimicrobiota bacterium]MBT3632817.1 hypothetical protein [Candidatus Neomarinimicrobiota bacterium]MBT3681927.1 hypothetical protein [Candidatus Neomarinimicrobiota bacterium]MBT3759044.1 hypothetical protein [Candidatus Neomarinimicrobiota bacterium]MBT3895057.1 hypothetical protein [Candidatus Neomarinimicrobiota bacterium]